jgi:hypothetical protein
LRSSGVGSLLVGFCSLMDGWMLKLPPRVR